MPNPTDDQVREWLSLAGNETLLWAVLAKEVLRLREEARAKDGIIEELREALTVRSLRLERDSRTYATMQKGMESQAELMHGLKQRVRELEAEVARLREYVARPPPA